MFPFSARRLAQGLGGELIAEGSEASYANLVTDSRKVKKGDIYLALKGERFNGEAFFEKAAKAGAAALVGRKPPRIRGCAAIRVPDGLLALQALARDQRRLFEGPVIAITGSNGKTGVKECLAHLLGEGTLATQGNFNNHIGLPLTLLRLQPGHRAAVLELGMNHYGELALLGKISRPDVALELNVGDAHIGFFKDRAGVAKAKEELLEAMGSSGIAVLNGDDPLVAAMGRRFRGRQIRFGTGKGNDLRLSRIQDRGASGLKADLSWQGRALPLRLPMGGKARRYQALAALGGALAAGRELKGLLPRLGSFRPQSQGRLQLERLGGVSFILDTYNASPQSMDAALEFLELSAPRGRRLAILGDMLELGAAAGNFQRALGRRARKAGLRVLGALGPRASATLEGFGGAGAAFQEEDAAGAAAFLKANLKAGDWVLLKGSRGMAVERVFAGLKEKG